MSISDRTKQLTDFVKGPSSFDWIGLLILAGVLVRLIFMGILNLLPEEAYHWNYAQHLDIGYLEHPPMVAWLIHLSEAVLGRSELAVRLPAFLSWFGLAYFMFRRSTDIIGRSTGKVVLLLLASLLIYMSVGFLMTPDAPFYVCWASTLYFLAKAVTKGEARAWYGAGVSLGLGLLSKYTMGLIVPAAVGFMLIDKEARQWFRKLQPYIALFIGLVLFSPVLYWNAEHQGMSFAFQGTRVWSGGMDFNLHILIGSMLVLLSPLGFYEAVRVIWDVSKRRVAIQQEDLRRYRQYLFLLIFSVVPLALFGVHSIQGQPKLNWTGPVWLSLLPLIAARIYGPETRHSKSNGGLLARRWLVTASVLVVFYAAGFAYMVGGMPGIEKSSGLKFPIAWKIYGDKVEEIETRLEDSTGTEPIIIGLDKYWLASQANFYDRDHDTEIDSLPEIGGQNLIGKNGLMWNTWVTPESINGRDALLISFGEGQLNESVLSEHFADLGAVNSEQLENCDGEIGHFYWQVGYGYTSKARQEAKPLAIRK
jgi:dolichol-phosphate mannosyltransferase